MSERELDIEIPTPQKKEPDYKEPPVDHSQGYGEQVSQELFAASQVVQAKGNKTTQKKTKSKHIEAIVFDRHGK